jgi:hypothetical protein
MRMKRDFFVADVETPILFVRQCPQQAGNPYHNSVHAADVVQSVSVFLFPWGVAADLTDSEVFACVLSAIIHDAAHPGRT